MYRITCFLFIFLVASTYLLHGQQTRYYISTKIAGQVFNAKTKEQVPFATIKFDGGSHGTVAGLDGRFEIPGGRDDASWIEVSCLGYITKKVYTVDGNMDIYIEPDSNMLHEVVIKPPYEKMRRILNNAIANKPINNPDKYDWYRCHVYYKMIADASLPDSPCTDLRQVVPGLPHDQHSA